MENISQVAEVEAILFAMGDSVENSKIINALNINSKELRNIIKELKEKYNNSNSGIKLMELDGAIQLCTKPEMYDALIRVCKQPKRHVMTDVLMETLSIIAYKQPVTKGEIERIRGVKSDHAVNKLVEYELVCEVGRLDTPGKPILFGTTEEFMRRFGVEGMDGLPPINEEIVEEFKEEADKEITMTLND